MFGHLLKLSRNRNRRILSSTITAAILLLLLVSIITTVTSRGIRPVHILKLAILSTCRALLVHVLFPKPHVQNEYGIGCCPAHPLVFPGFLLFLHPLQTVVPASLSW